MTTTDSKATKRSMLPWALMDIPALISMVILSTTMPGASALNTLVVLLLCIPTLICLARRSLFGATVYLWSPALFCIFITLQHS